MGFDAVKNVREFFIDIEEGGQSLGNPTTTDSLPAQ